jgi:hypothetical protein
MIVPDEQAAKDRAIVESLERLLIAVLQRKSEELSELEHVLVRRMGYVERYADYAVECSQLGIERLRFVEWYKRQKAQTD